MIERDTTTLGRFWVKSWNQALLLGTTYNVGMYRKKMGYNQECDIWMCLKMEL